VCANLDLKSRAIARQVRPWRGPVTSRAVGRGFWTKRLPALRPSALLLTLLALIVAALPSSAASRLKGQPAPDFALKALNGENMRLSEFRGQVVMINFWASWAGPSRMEMPRLEKIAATYKGNGFALLGVNMDDTVASATNFANAYGITYPLLLDLRKDVVRRYEVETVPVTVLIDRGGTVRFVHQDYRVGAEETYVAEIRALLKE
jgi:peroxiredoxin